jgi:preprotein translocase subunit SecD
MKKAIVVAALVFPVLCQAQDVSPQKINNCNQQAMLVNMAASYRDSQQSPQEFMKFANQKRSIFNTLTDQQIKRMINVVYFDERFAGLPPQVLQQAVSDQCINPAPQYQPIQ